MRGLTLTKNSRRPSETADVAVDIDVTPVMNMFIILIPFLVSMAVFTQVSIVEFSLPPNVGANLDDSAGKPKLKITVVVTPTFTGITLGEKMLDSIPAIDGEHDYETLAKRLAIRRQSADIKNEVVVAVRDEVVFEKVIAVMDRCRETGFEKVGLSSAPEEGQGQL